MHGALIISSLSSVTDMEIAKINTSFLEVQDIS